MIISVLSEKGGVGKSTLTINLARCFKHLGYRVLLVDSDRQGSARDWHQNGNGDMLEVIGLDRPTLDKDIVKFKDRYDLIFIDGAPGITEMTIKALLCSDVILMPVQPAQFDVWASSSLVDLVKQRQEIANGKPKCAFVISREIINTKLSKGIANSLDEYGIPVFKSRTSQRVAYIEVLPTGRTVLESQDELAKSEIWSIAKELSDFCGMNWQYVDQGMEYKFHRFEPRVININGVPILMSRENDGVVGEASNVHNKN